MNFFQFFGYSRLLIVSLTCCLCACGGSAGGDAGDIARDESTPLNDAVQLSDDAGSQEQGYCLVELDIADFFLTEIDRQWSCEITSAAGTDYREVYFTREGRAIFAASNVWYWNRNLPGDDVTLLSPDQPAKVMSQISSSNVLLNFTTTTASGGAESYECLLVPRDVNS